MSDENKEIDKVITIDINKEMQKCYIDYAMSVIVARALPDVRDGLKAGIQKSSNLYKR